MNAIYLIYKDEFRRSSYVLPKQGLCAGAVKTRISAASYAMLAWLIITVWAALSGAQTFDLNHHYLFLAVATACCLPCPTYRTLSQFSLRFQGA